MNNENSKQKARKAAIVIIPIVFALAITLTVATMMNGGVNTPASGGISQPIQSTPLPVAGTPGEPTEPQYSIGLSFRANPDGTATVIGLGSCADKIVRIPATSPDGDIVAAIGDSAFASVMKIDTVIMPDSIVSIGAYAFKGSSITEITVGSSVLSIGSAAFADCTGLTEIKVDGANPLFASANGVLFDREFRSLICYPSGRPDTSYTIPDTVKEIKAMAFSSCSALKKLKYGGNAKAWGTVYVASGNELLDSITIEVNTSDK